VVVLLLAVCFLAAGSWYLARPKPSPPFEVQSSRVTARVTPSLSVGKNFAAMVAPDGSLWAWGEPDFEMGLERGWVPQRLGREYDWKQVTTVWAGLVALKQDGTLWALGSNGEGLLGTTDRARKVAQLARLGNASDWREVQGGVAHCMGLKQDGSLWTWGQNQYGQIGCGTVSPSEPFTRVDNATNWVAISPGSFNSFALRADGTLWMWGLPLSSAGPNITAPIQFGSETNWVKIAAGDYHLAARRSDGTMWLVGANGGLIEGSVQNPVTNWVRMEGSDDWAEFYSGENIVFARRADGSWVSKGGERGSGEGGWQFHRKFAPLSFRSDEGTSLMLMPDGRLWSVGKRVGTHSAHPFERMAHRARHLVGLNSALAEMQVVDRAHVLLWEQPSD
jgi:hypothetical protein